MDYAYLHARFLHRLCHCDKISVDSRCLVVWSRCTTPTLSLFPSLSLTFIHSFTLRATRFFSGLLSISRPITRTKCAPRSLAETKLYFLMKKFHQPVNDQMIGKARGTDRRYVHRRSRRDAVAGTSCKPWLVKRSSIFLSKS